MSKRYRFICRRRYYYIGYKDSYLPAVYHVGACGCCSWRVGIFDAIQSADSCILAGVRISCLEGLIEPIHVAYLFAGSG